MKEHIELKNTVFGDFSTPLLIMDRTTTKKIIKKTECLNNTIKHQDLTDIYLYSTPPNSSSINILLKYTRNMPRIGHILGHKIRLNKFKMSEVYRVD